MSASTPLLRIPSVETHLLRSRHVDQEFQIQVLPPIVHGRVDSPMPVVLVADANLLFTLCSQIVIGMRSGDEIPPFVLAGIGYPSPAPHAGAMLRRRDLTFPGYPALSSAVPAFEGVLHPPAGGPLFGGAPAFQKFIGEELLPSLASRYPVRREDVTFFGHSAAAGFGFYTLCTRPSLFRRLILSSPGLSFHGMSSGGVEYENYTFGLDLARDLIVRRPRFTDTLVHLSVGELEENEPDYVGWRLVSSARQLASSLQDAQLDGLRLEFELLPGETHMSVPPIAFSRGIRAVFR